MRFNNNRIQDIYEATRQPHSPEQNFVASYLLNKVDMMRLLTWMGVSMIVSPKRIPSEENNGRDSDRRTTAIYE